MARSRAAVGGMSDMALKAPGIITFMLSVILTVLALVTKAYPDAGIPFIASQELYVLLVAQIVLIMGCIMRGL